MRDKKLLKHAERVRDLALVHERDPKLKRLEARVQAGDEHLRPFRDRKLAENLAKLERVHAEADRAA
jgi:hypothetical protein